MRIAPAPFLAPVPSPAPQARPEQRGSVLIVDDSRLTRSVFCRTLSINYDCLTATSYEEANKLLKTRAIDVVVTDVIIPGLSGIELLRKVVDTYPQVEVIVVLSVDRPQRVVDALRIGAFDYLIKPCELSLL